MRCYVLLVLVCRICKDFARQHSNPISQVRANSFDEFFDCWVLLKEILTVSLSVRRASFTIVPSSFYISGLGV